MMKRLLLTMLSVISVVMLAFGLTACKGGDNDGNGGTEEKAFTVTYDYDGTLTRGGVTLAEKTETVKESALAAFTLPVAEKKGYTFNAWQNGGVDFNAANLSGNVTLTPKFTANEYSLTYDYDGTLTRGGVTLETKTETVTYDNLEGFILPAAVKRGYAFNGWTVDGAAFDKTALDASAAYTLAPAFTVNAYTVIYDFDGDVLRDGVKLTEKTETVTFENLAAYKTPVAYKKGYTFEKWMNGGMEFDKSGIDASATYTLKPKFKANEYTFVYDYDGTLTRGGAELTEKMEAITADNIMSFTFPDAEKTGNEFTGWTVDGAVFDILSLDKSATVTLTASFKPKTYKVSYYLSESDASAKTNCVLEDEATYGANYTVKNQQYLLNKGLLTDDTPEFNYDIIGWKVFSGNDFVSGNYTYTYDTTLVAVKSQGEMGSYNITYKVYGRKDEVVNVKWGDDYTLKDVNGYSVNANKGYHLGWTNKNGSEITSGKYNYKYSLVLTLTEVKNKATVNFVVAPEGATDKMATLETKTAILSTGDAIPQAVYTDNVKIKDGKVYVYKFNYWTLEKAYSGTPEKAYDDCGEIVIETDDSPITLYAYFTLSQETPNT